MATANYFQRLWIAIWASLKSQWLASTLLIPLGFLLYSNHVQREAAREDRIETVNVDRLNKIQDSGKSLDLALASYFQSIADLGLAQRHVRMPGAFESTSVKQAQLRVVERRDEARKALAEHASDVQRLRGTLNESASSQYMAALAGIDAAVEGEADIDRTGANITALSKLVVTRNAMVDSAMAKIG